MYPENTYHHCDSSTKRSKCGRTYDLVDVEQQQQLLLSLVFDHASNERIKKNHEM